MTGDRRPEEVAVVVRRPGDEGPEYLVLLRAPEWHDTPIGHSPFCC